MAIRNKYRFLPREILKKAKTLNYKIKDSLEMTNSVSKGWRGPGRVACGQQKASSLPPPSSQPHGH